MSRIENRRGGVDLDPEAEALACEGPAELAAGGSPAPDDSPLTPPDGVDGSSPELLYTPAGAPAGTGPEGGGSAVSRELEQILALVRLGLDPTGGAASSSPARAAAGASSPDDIGRNLAGLQVVHREEQATVHNPWDINRLAPSNRGGKKTEFQQLKKAEANLAEKREDLATAERNLDRARAKHVEAPTPKTAAAVTAAEAKVDRASSAVAGAEANVAKEENELRQVLKEISKAPDSAIDELELRGQPFTRDRYDITVGDTVIELKNGIDSSATTDAKGLDGRAAGDSKAVVGGAIDASEYSDSVKTVLKATSANEGTFTSINGYDKKALTFGFIQMAGGGPGETLSNMLHTFKKQHPDAFAATLRKYGVDTEATPKGPQLVVHEPDGNVLKGDAAAKKIGTDPRLAAALSASGMNREMQQAQLDFAKDYLDRQRKEDITVGGQSVKISDLITSERGNGLLFDRSVHEGHKGARDVLTDVARDYLQAHPAARLSDEAARAAIETAYIDRVRHTKDLETRSANVVRSTSDVRGSYHD
jgi:hypothetical protein